MPHVCGCVRHDITGYDPYSRWWRTASEGTTLRRDSLWFETTRTPSGMFPYGASVVCGGANPPAPPHHGGYAPPYPPRWRRRKTRAASTLWLRLEPWGCCRQDARRPGALPTLWPR